VAAPFGSLDAARYPRPVPIPTPEVLVTAVTLEPASLRPMLAVPGSMGDVGRDHTYEFKWDGVRALVFVDPDGGLDVRSRNGTPVAARYPELAGLADAARRPVVLDGEIVALDEGGRPSFAALQPRMHLADPGRAAAAAARAPVALLLFDLLALDGEAWFHRPLEERRAALLGLGLSGGRWSVPPATDDLEAALAIADERGLEGVVAKRRGSSYRPGLRSRDWVKLRIRREQEVVVGGWRPGRGSLTGRIGSLLVGVHDDEGRLCYAGGVGSGLKAGDAARLASRFEVRDRSPFTDEVAHADARFVEPRVVVQVGFTEWTPDGRLRHPVFLGERDDVDPAAVHRDP
jgi:bifunctional non-homologous end joining protein LigD